MPHWEDIPYRGHMLSRRALTLAAVVAAVTLVTWRAFGGAGVEALSWLAGIGSFALMLQTLNHIQHNSKVPDEPDTASEPQEAESPNDGAAAFERAPDPASDPARGNSVTTDPAAASQQSPPPKADVETTDPNELHQPGDQGGAAQWMLAHPAYTRIAMAVVAVLVVGLLTMIGRLADGATAGDYECVMGICYTTSSR